MGRLYGEPSDPELGDYWRTPDGWAAYLPSGVVMVEEYEAREKEGTLVFTAWSVVEVFGAGVSSVPRDPKP